MNILKEYVKAYLAANGEAVKTGQDPDWIRNRNLVGEPVKAYNEGRGLGMSGSIPVRGADMSGAGAGTAIADPDARTWQDVADRRHLDLGTPEGMRRDYVQRASIADLRRNIGQGENPLVENAYEHLGGTFYMSREAMMRRLNMLNRQRARDERMRRALAAQQSQVK